jgi:hypothetical protein
MRTAIIALLSAFWLAAQSTTVKIDVDGICPIAVITLAGPAPGDCDDDDDDYRKLHGPTITFTMVYTDSSIAAAGELGPRLVQEFHVGKLPLYQINAAWRI